MYNSIVFGRVGERADDNIACTNGRHTCLGVLGILFSRRGTYYFQVVIPAIRTRTMKRRHDDIFGRNCKWWGGGSMYNVRFKPMAVDVFTVVPRRTRPKGTGLIETSYKLK